MLDPIQPFLADPMFEPRLRRLIARVCPGMQEAQFLSAVSSTFKRAQQALPQSDMEALLRRSKGHGLLLQTLTELGSRLPRPARVLVLGCGVTYAGIGAAYPAALIRESMNDLGLERVDCTDLTEDELRTSPQGSYDLVLAHSLAHFIPSLDTFFRYVQDRVCPGGYFVLAREPNSRFWQNMEIQKAVQDFRSSRTKAGSTSSARKWMARLKAGIRGTGAVQVHDAVNRILQEEHHFINSLSNNEIARLVDPHLPSEFGGEFSIGFEGLDWVVLRERFLPLFREISIETWEHLGRAHEAAQTFPQREATLAAKFPEDGCFFTVVWQK